MGPDAETVARGGLSGFESWFMSARAGSRAGSGWKLPLGWRWSWVVRSGGFPRTGVRKSTWVPEGATPG